mmetsp:Transcript_18567/g.45989  ORF Transcript_18567/g.45989 Transcript_18567/m.45989 type:complete len:216 (-) Transcript_18567:169-816(-)
MVGKEGLNALFTQIGGSIPAGTRTNGWISQFQSRLGLGIPIMTIPSLNVTNNHLSACLMISIMGKGFHAADFPIRGIPNPSRIGCELVIISNQRFYHVLSTTFGVNCPTRYHDFLSICANLIPGFGHINGLVGNLKILGKEFVFNPGILRLESFASGNLLVAIATNVDSLVAFSKSSFTKLVIGHIDIVGSQIGSGCARIGHDWMLLSFQKPNSE